MFIACLTKKQEMRMPHARFVNVIGKPKGDKMADSYEHGTGPLHSMKGRELLD
jgi:hypothetical protein